MTEGGFPPARDGSAVGGGGEALHTVVFLIPTPRRGGAYLVHPFEVAERTMSTSPVGCARRSAVSERIGRRERCPRTGLYPPEKAPP